MKIASVADVKANLSAYIKASEDELVVITKNGKPVAVVYSFEEHHHIERAKLEWLKAAIAEGDADVAAGHVYEMNDELIAAIKSPGRSFLDD